MRIAVIGAGVSGLVCAHILHGRHELVVFEAGAYAGGHANTVDVPLAEGTHAVDTGFIVFNDRNYPNFERLLGELGVATQPSDMSFSVSDGRDFEYNGSSPNGLFANRAHLRDRAFHRMIGDLVRFNRDARVLLASDADPALNEWLEQQRYSEAFIRKLIVPQAAAVWSADPEQMWSFPARFMLDFFSNHGMLGFRGRPQWRTVTGGSRAYVEAITRPWVDQLRLSTAVERVSRSAGCVRVSARGAPDPDPDPEEFDAVVFACHSDQALAILGDDATDTERELLGAIPYRRNEAVLHTDRSLLPRRRRAWASWNYHLDGDSPGSRPALTYHMNRLQSLPASRELCVTLNRTEAIDPALVIRKLDYAHPVYTRAGIAAQRRHHEISGQNRTHYCGAYWAAGFHEDGVLSGLRVAREVGVRGAVPTA
jgi:predicted NAD/FAD-binding protein